MARRERLWRFHHTGSYITQSQYYHFVVPTITLTYHRLLIISIRSAQLVPYFIINVIIISKKKIKQVVISGYCIKFV